MIATAGRDHPRRPRRVRQSVDAQQGSARLERTGVLEQLELDGHFCRLGQMLADRIDCQIQTGGMHHPAAQGVSSGGKFIGGGRKHVSDLLWEAAGSQSGKPPDYTTQNIA